jgi:YCII-related domain
MTSDSATQALLRARVCLRPRSGATTVPVRDGKALICDGRFAGTKEQLGGCCLVDGKDLDDAIDVAWQLPGALTGTIQVRPAGVGGCRARIELARESSVATMAPTINGVVLALSSAAQFMVVLDGSEVAMRKLAQTTFVTQTA